MSESKKVKSTAVYICTSPIRYALKDVPHSCILEIVHFSLLSVYNFIRRRLVKGLAEKIAKSKSKSNKSGLKSGLKSKKSKSGLEYYKSEIW